MSRQQKMKILCYFVAFNKKRHSSVINQSFKSYFLKFISLQHTHPFSDPLSGTTRMSWYHKGKTNLDFTDARDSEWQWHPLCHMQVCTSLHHASTPPLSFLQAGCHSCRPANRVKALKAFVSLQLGCIFFI